MDLEVSSIKFLSSGKISVEVISKASTIPPGPPALDSALLRFYMECRPTDTIQQIKDAALQLARQSVR